MAVPTIGSITRGASYALRPCAFRATVTNTPTRWEWDFGGGATPNTSTLAYPGPTLGLAGSYTVKVRAGNAEGWGAWFSQPYTVLNKRLPLRLTVLTKAGAKPKLPGTCAAWTASEINKWLTAQIVPVFTPAGLLIDRATLQFVENPALFDIETDAEQTALYDLMRGQVPDAINLAVLNSNPYSRKHGNVTDSTCNWNNAGRFGYVVFGGGDWDRVNLAHELGHYLGLPHARTQTVPLTAANQNLMSYGSMSTALIANAVREEPSSCTVYEGNPVDQPRVMNLWGWQNF